MKVAGTIPKEIIYVSRDPESLITKWDNAESDADIITKGTYKPSFPADASNPNTVKTGMTWASGYRNNNKIPTSLTLPNDPISAIRLVGLEKRSEGGRAYKVVIHKDILVDLREDVLLELMIEEGIQKNGLINGSYVWGRVGSQMKLVRVGSILHDALVANTQIATQPKLKALEIGGVYRGKSPKKYVYLGTFSTVEMSNVRVNNNTNYARSVPAAQYEIHYKELNDMMAFLEVPSYYGKNVDEIFESTGKHFSSISYNIQFKKSHTMVEKVDQMSVIDLVAYVENLADDKKYPAREMKEYANYPVVVSKLACIRQSKTPFKVPAIFDQYMINSVNIS